MSDSKVTEISNPAAYGWQWTSQYDGFDGVYEHEITWARGSDVLFYGTKAPASDRMTMTPIRNPERFGFNGTLSGARAAVNAFLAEAASRETA